MTEFEKMGCTYRQEGDYFLPNLKIGARKSGGLFCCIQAGLRALSLPHKLQHFLLLWDAVDAAVVAGGEAGGAAGEAGDGGHVLC